MTPTSLDSPEPLRDLPGRPRRERTWKDEVRDRVRERRQNRQGPDLPLFPEEGNPDMAPVTDPHPGKAPAGDESREVELPRREEAAPASFQGSSDSLSTEEENPEWSLGVAGQEESPPSVERPALPGERLRAGALDALVLLVLWGCTVYFSARVARVSLLGLVPSWPYLLAYLMFLGIVYAAYFTGMTGQTLGKMALRLYVVDPSGRPPGHLRAFARALIGAAGVILAGASVIPMFFDPARRGLHDRLLRTRVIRA